MQGKLYKHIHLEKKMSREIKTFGKAKNKGDGLYSLLGRWRHRLKIYCKKADRLRDKAKTRKEW